jgi:hypothetical protein
VAEADAIVVAKVKGVDRIDRQSSDKEHLGKVTLTVEVLEILKGEVGQEIQVYDVDLGGGQASPYPPLRDPVGRELFLCLLNEPLRPKGGDYKVFGQALVEKGTVRHACFALWGEKSLRDIRSITAELMLIQRVCPRTGEERERWKQDATALAACQTALHSQHEDVVWYAARHLFTRKGIPESLLDELMDAVRREKKPTLAREALLRCIGKVGRLRAVPFLIEVLRSEPRDVAAAQALKELTGEEFGKDVDAWQRWWDKHRPR